MQKIFSQLDKWQQQGEEIALATLVNTRGPSPRPWGARMGLTRTGQMVGSVSSGCVEGDIFERAQQVLDTGQPIIQTYSIANETSVAVGLSCGGSIDVLIECFSHDATWRKLSECFRTEEPTALCLALSPGVQLEQRMVVTSNKRTGSISQTLDATICDTARNLLATGGRKHIDLSVAGQANRISIEALLPAPRLYIVGATHAAIALCRMAKQTDFHVSVIDPRTPFATQERFADADELILDWPQVFFATTHLDHEAFVVCLSHDLKFDIPTLCCALRSQARYIGALGSRRTGRTRMERLREEGFDDADLARIHTPIGLDIGAKTPEEIALSILAEIVAVRRDRHATPLPLKDAPIHLECDAIGTQ